MAISLKNKNDSKLDVTNYDSLVKMTNASIMGTTGMALKEINSFYSLSQISDPVSISFKLFFRYDSQFGLLAPETADHKSNSAIDYLERIGERTRAQLLRLFISHLQFLNMEMSYVFQTIDGLDTIRTHKPWETYKDDSKITIGTLETIDFKVQSLMSMYKDIWFDYERNVEILPANLRRFDVSIFIFAMGSYQIVEGKDGIDSYSMMSIPNIKRQYNNSVLDKNPTNTDSMYVKAPDMYNHICYDLSECEFLPWESQDGMHKPTNATAEWITNTISFSFRWCKDAWRFHGLTGDAQFSASAIMAYAAANDAKESKSLMEKFGDFKHGLFGESVFGQIGESLFDKAAAPLTNYASDILDKYGSLEKLKNEGIKAGLGLLENAADYLGDKIAGKIQGMFLGNVYNVSASNVIGALTGDNLAGSLTQLAAKATGSSKSTKAESKLEPGTNVYNKM